jgi:hypothetical protein
MPSSTIIFLRNNAAFLPWVGNLDEAKKLGLSNGSLYDVMITAYPDSGTAVVSATGFNITCGYIPGIIANKVPCDGCAGKRDPPHERLGKSNTSDCCKCRIHPKNRKYDSGFIYE